MTTLFVLFSNLLIPLVSGLFFLFYFIYFVFTHPSRATSYRLFVIFLIGFSLFLFGRPLQLLLGPHPLPLIIVNIRVFILCSVLAPVIILTARTYNKRISRRGAIGICLACLPLGLTYVVFNSLGTRGSYLLFEAAGLVGYDNLTPSRLAPFYGREVTIGVQAVTGFLLLFFSCIRLAQSIREAPPRSWPGDKVFLINAGIVIFALSFILGSLAKQWWVYYVASVATALLCGGSVLIDIKAIHNYYEKLVPFIKEEIVNNVTFSEFSKIKLIEMLKCLGKKTDLNTFVAIKIKEAARDIRGDFSTIEGVIGIVNRRLETALSDDSCLILPISDDSVGIVLRLPREKESRKQADILGAFDDIRDEVSKTYRRGLAVGIGRSYDRIEDLRISYQEALNAREYAEQLGDCGIVHVDNINEPDRHRNNYPVREKEALLALIRSGDTGNCRSALAVFFAKFRRYIADEPEVLRIRLHELICSFVDSAILGGGDEKILNALIVKYIDNIALITDPLLAERYLAQVVDEIAGSVVNAYRTRSKVLIESAKKYMEANYRSQLSYRDVASEIYISPSYFLSLFKRETGTTFVDYLTTLRIEKAKSLLLTTEASITQIAFDVGFNNSNYFSNTFRKAVGLSAKEYRKPR